MITIKQITDNRSHACIGCLTPSSTIEIQLYAKKIHLCDECFPINEIIIANQRLEDTVEQYMAKEISIEIFTQSVNVHVQRIDKALGVMS